MAEPTGTWALETGQDISTARFALNNPDVQIIWWYWTGLEKWMVYVPAGDPLENTLGYMSVQHAYWVHRK